MQLFFSIFPGMFQGCVSGNNTDGADIDVLLYTVLDTVIRYYEKEQAPT